MSLRFSATVSARDFAVDLDVDTGETVAVLGPNGAGKSTLVELLSGLLRADTGSATLDGELLFRAPHEWYAPHRRAVAVLSQDPLLFPHLNVIANVAFGPRSGGSSRAESRVKALEWLGAVDAEQLTGRRANELSGGEAQRVAIARALAREPRLLLLDEPMAALDITVAPTIRATLRRVLADRTTIFVTHDVLDAVTLADRVVVMERGRIVEQGATRTVLERPQTRFAAAIGGLVLLEGARTGAGIRLADGTELVADRHDDASPGDRVAASVRPASVGLAAASAPIPAPNSMRRRVTAIEPRGELVRVHADSIHADVVPSLVADNDVGMGTEVDFQLPPGALAVYRSVVTSPPTGR